jgi:hypothetical protein
MAKRQRMAEPVVTSPKNVDRAGDEAIPLCELFQFHDTMRSVSPSPQLLVQH